MAKKRDLPAMPFYFGDWRKAPEVRALDLATRMIWFEMLGYMWESTERGYLTLNGQPVITPVISRMLGIDITTMEKALAQLEQFEVFSRREDGAIFCRKMIRDEEMRKQKAAAGIEGMKKRYGAKKQKKSVITQPITLTENETIIENEFEIQSDYVDIFKSWLDYKKARRENYKTPQSRELCYKKLFKFSRGFPHIAKQIIEDAMANNYAGFFEPKINSNGKQPHKTGHDLDGADAIADSILSEHARNKKL